MAALALTELSLSHFRSHKRANLQLDARPVALFGPNGAGKTNILEAISLLSPGRGLRRASLSELARQPENLGWKISAALTSLGQHHEIETRAEPDQPRSVRIDGKSATQTALGRIARIVWLIPAMDRLWLEGADGRRRFLDRITLSFEPLHAEATLAYEKAMRERNRLLKDMVRDQSWYAALERQMAAAGSRIIARRAEALARLQQAIDAGGSSFPQADLSLQDPDEAPGIDSEAALLAALDASRPLDLRAGRTLVGPHRVDLAAVFRAKGTPAKLCSTGEQKALLLSLILANARALSEDFGAPPILLLDEVAAHLDAGRRASLYDEICALGAQAFMTGTGAELFADLGPRAQHFDLVEENGVSSLREIG